MPNPPYGSEPKPGSPEWFFFEGTDIATNLAPFASTLSLAAMGLSGNPQNTADFCSGPPPSDLPGPLDYAAIAFPPEALLSGAYGRLGNQIKASKWDELCQWKAPPVHVNPVDPPDGYTMYYQGEHVAIDTTLHAAAPGAHGMIAAWVNDGIPANCTGIAWRITFEDTTPNGVGLIHNTAPLHVGEDMDFEASAGRNWYTDFHPAAPISDWAVQGIGPHPYTPKGLCIVWGTSPRGIVNVTFDVAVKLDPGVPPGPPPPIDPPPDYPTSGGPCDAVTLSDLCRAINGLQGTLDTILRKVDPPALVAGPDPTPVVDDPAVPPVPGVPTPKAPVAKPPLAVGLIITCTGIPNTVARYGTGPTFYPALGHIAMMTADGPLPSVLIKHNPMVLTPLPAVVKKFGIDLAPGVEAELTWLYPPTDPPKP